MSNPAQTGDSPLVDSIRLFVYDCFLCDGYHSILVDDSLEFTVEGNPDYGQLTVRLGPDERFIAEGGSMAWRSKPA